MIDEALIKTNFVGKDGFSWWIGRVAHSDYWKNINLANNLNSSSGQRVKVRIIGYHPWDNTLEEDDLPWAHVMMDAVSGSGQGSQGDTINLVGGETAIGFFLDGEEAQQPVIIGLLHRTAEVEYSITDSEVKTVKSSKFEPISGFPKGKVPPSKDKSPTTENPPPVNKEFTTGKLDNASKNIKDQQSVAINKGDATKAANAATAKGTEKVIDPSMCGDGVVSEISQALTDFIAFTNTLENSVDRFIDPVTQKIVDMSARVKSTAKMISSTIKSVINNIRTGIIKKVLSLFKIFSVINKKVNPLDYFLGPTAKKAFMKVLEMLYCLFGKIFGDIGGFIENMLGNMVSKIINGPFCAVEQFVSGILSKAFQFIEDGLAPILNGIEWLTGGVGQITAFLSKASSLARQIFSFLECTGIKCEQPSEWISSTNVRMEGKLDNWEKSVQNVQFLDGVQNDLKKFQEKVGNAKIMQWLNGENTEEARTTYINGSNALELISTIKKLSGGKVDPSNILGNLEGAIGSLSIFGNGHSALSACDDSIWNPKTQYDLIDIPLGHYHWTCIPPVSEVVGTGFGAVTKPIVGENGSIFSVEVIHAGSGYDHTTSVAIIDRSNYGSGAQAKAIVENGSLKEVVLLSSGSGYCGGNTDDVSGTTPDINIPVGIGTGIVGVVTSVYVYTTGVGYTSGDTADIGGEILPIVITDNGSIVEIDPSPISSLGFSKRPSIIINSTTGFGAELIPVMKYNVQYTGDSLGDTVVPLVGITSVIDCPPEDHVFRD